ncbi:MAG TPA: hypothetical protein VFK78_03285 [Gemmatimonadales bacterium]|nr:hypothetical protein [Gemmatimonadales bacterium]
MYHHTQSGPRTVLALVVGAVIIAFLPAPVPLPIRVLVPVALAGAAYAFASLTTEVDQSRFTFWFGPGVWRRSFLLAEIRSVRPVPNPWWQGRGIHWTGSGWNYSVAGREAVEFILTNGSRFRVGTDEPETLCRMITQLKGSG